MQFPVKMTPVPDPVAVERIAVAIDHVAVDLRDGSDERREEFASYADGVRDALRWIVGQQQTTMLFVLLGDADKKLGG